MKTERTGVLLLHGLGGGNYETEGIYNILKSQVDLIAMPELPGHADNYAGIGRVKYIEWINKAEEEYLKLEQVCSKTVIIGFSMGGLIGGYLCQKYSPTGFVSINTPVYFWNLKRVLINIATDLKSRDFANINFYLSSAAKLPFTTLTQFLLLLVKAQSYIGKIASPCLICQGLLDDAVYPASATAIYRKVKSSDKSLITYQKSDHRIFAGVEKDALEHDVQAFVGRVFERDLE